MPTFSASSGSPALNSKVEDFALPGGVLDGDTFRRRDHRLSDGAAWKPVAEPATQLARMKR